MPGLVELQPSDLLAHGLPGGASAAASWVRSLRAFHAAAHLAHPEAQGQQQQATFTVWRAVSKDLLRPPPENPFELHQLPYDAVYDAWDVSVLGPRPVWIPTAEVRRARLSACVQRFCICWEALASAVCSEYYSNPGDGHWVSPRVSPVAARGWGCACGMHFDQCASHNLGPGVRFDRVRRRPTWHVSCEGTTDEMTERACM